MTADKGQTPIRWAAGEEVEPTYEVFIQAARAAADVQVYVAGKDPAIATLTAQLAAAEARVAVAAEALRPFALLSEASDAGHIKGLRRLHGEDAAGMSDDELVELVDPAVRVKVTDGDQPPRRVVTAGDFRRAASFFRNLTQETDNAD